MSDIVTVADKHDARNFVVGMPLVLDNGRFVRPRWKHKLQAAWRRVTWWRQDHCITTAIDYEAGAITVAPMRWSWLRWKWVQL